MIAIDANLIAKSGQYMVNLQLKPNQKVKRAHPSHLNTAVHITKSGVNATTSGSSPRRLCDALDSVLEAYEEEFGDYSRNVCIDVKNKRQDVYDKLIEYLFRSSYVKHAKVGKLSVK